MNIFGGFSAAQAWLFVHGAKAARSKAVIAKFWRCWIGRIASQGSRAVRLGTRYTKALRSSQLRCENAP